VRDDDEFVAFVEQSGSRLRDTAFWLCRDWSLAQDLTQATLIKGDAPRSAASLRSAAGGLRCRSRSRPQGRQ
jgi:DNA-directed RNA polymerase specialized sigma24 family protein